MKPQEFKIILWDFDGVIIESNSVRENGFKEVLRMFPSDQVEKLLVYHNINGGLSRYVKFRYFFEEIRKEKITEEKVDNLSSQFSVIMKKNLKDPNLLITPIVEFIKNQYNTGKIMHIVSGSDQVELRGLCEDLKINHFFKSINGSPTHKSKLVENVINNDNELPSSYCLIGDSINDYEAAQDNSITFFGYNNQKIKNLEYYFDI